MKHAITTISSLLSVIVMVSTHLMGGEINIKEGTGKKAQVVASSISPVTESPINAEVQIDKNNQIPYPAMKDDLVNAGSEFLAEVLMENFKPFQKCNAKALNDGTVGLPGRQDAVTFDLDGKWTTTFVLDTAKSARGYDIKEIRTIAGWPPNRACQKYQLLISKTSSPDKFISLGTFSADARKGLATIIKLTGKKGSIGNNVAAIKFEFMVPKSAVGGATQTTYREIDIVGTKSTK